MRKTFKGLPVCQKHNIAYHWKQGCVKCNAEKRKNQGERKPLDVAMEKIEAQMNSTICHYCNKNEAMEGHSYRFMPICHDCCYTKSPRYKDEYDKNNSDSN